MYNLTVDEAHTFFVGDGDWLVHNTCRVDFPNLESENLYSALELLKTHDPERYAQLVQLYEAKRITLDIVETKEVAGGMMINNGQGHGTLKIVTTGYPATDASNLVHELTHGFQPPGLTGRQAEQAAHQAAYDFVERANLVLQLDPADRQAHLMFAKDPYYLLERYGKQSLDEIKDAGPFW